MCSSTEESLASHWLYLVFDHSSKTKIHLILLELPSHIVVATWAGVA